MQHIIYSLDVLLETRKKGVKEDAELLYNNSTQRKKG